MNPSREEALFVLALEMPAEKRAAFMDRCVKATQHSLKPHEPHSSNTS